MVEIGGVGNRGEPPGPKIRSTLLGCLPSRYDPTPRPLVAVKPLPPIMTPADRLPDTAKDAAVLRARGLGFAYRGGTPVLRNISAGLHAGRVTALVGPNGAGKSTLLKLLLGQLTPTDGSVSVDGLDPVTLRPAALARRVTYLPQDADGGEAFTVRETVAMGRFAWGDHAHVDAALDRFEVAAVAHRPVAHLSGGQRQRVRLARAWAQSRGPGQVAVLADEPVAGLDLRHAHALMSGLGDMASEGLAVLVVLHDLDLAARYADDAWLLAEGTRSAAGPADRVLNPEALSAAYGLTLDTVTTPGGRVFFPAARGV